MGAGDKIAKHTFTHFGISGVVFTLLGAGIFCLSFPGGLFLDLAIAEESCHVLRNIFIRHLVFPRSLGFHVSVQR